MERGEVKGLMGTPYDLEIASLVQRIYELQVRLESLNYKRDQWIKKIETGEGEQ